MTRAWYPTPPLSEDKLREAVKAVEAAVEAGCVWPNPQGANGRSALREAAETLGLPRATLEHRIERAGRKLGLWPMGIDPGWEPRKEISYAERKARQAAREGKSGFAPVMPGFEVSSVKTTMDKNGQTVSTGITQSRELGEPFELPPTRREGKVTSHVVGAERRVAQEWIRHDPYDDPAAIIEAAKQAFEAYKGHAKIPPLPEISDADLMTVYPVADLHLGMFSWAKETGEDYDLDTARKLFAGTFGQLVDRAPASRHAVFLGLGDLFHADDTTNRTLRSGNTLDVDTRYAKVFRAGVMLVRAAIEMMLSKHESVTVRILPGNHDPHSSITLAIALSQFFDGHERVIVDSDPGMFFYLRFGRNLIGATHGHAAKPKDAAGMMAACRARDWGETEWRHFLFGHFHHSSKGGEGNGIVWEIFQTIAPKDAYHAGMGYWAGRSLTALTYHREAGPHARTQVNIPSTSIRARAS